VLASVAIALKPGSIPGLGGVRNPFGLEGAPWVIVAALAADLLFALCILASALSLVLRFRRAGEEERQQVKWIAFASSVVVIVTVITMAATLLSPAAAWFAGNTPVWLSLMQYSAQASLTAVPIAVGFAVLKYRLYDIDIIINRALVYGPLTATPALVYFGAWSSCRASSAR
jgi:fumarate reductase subunit C